MKIKDVLKITGGRTKVMILSADKNDSYIRLWNGIVDDIDFKNVPYGNYEIEHMTVINTEDILQLYFEYPKLTKREKSISSKNAVGYPYPTEWIDRLFIKYRNWEYIKELLTIRKKEEIYNEIKVIPDKTKDIKLN